MSKKEMAQKIIKSNSRGNFTVPCDKLYPFQWNWDSAFSALGIFTYDKQRGLSELNTLFNGQWKNGMIPQIIFHKENNNYYPGPDVWESNTTPETSCISQPPVLGTILWLMIVLGYHDKKMLNNYFDRIMEYHQWFVKNRDPYNKGLISIIHPWESGRDNSPDWDDALKLIEVDNELEIRRKDNSHMKDEVRPTDDDYNRYMQIVFKCKELEWNNKEIYDNGLFNVCDPGIQFIFIRACQDLYKMAIYLERKDCYELLEKWIYFYSDNCDKLWNNEINAYTSLNIKTGVLFKGISSSSMLFAYADVGTTFQQKKMMEHSKRILYFSRYGFPSYDPFKEEFNPKKYWRGPVWCIINFMLTLGFSHIHQIELANKIRKNTLQLIEDNGFFEYFDPYYGKGYGGNNFSWTAAIYLIFKSELFV